MFAPILMQSADLWQPPLLTRQPSISVNTQQIWNSFHDMYNMRLRQTEFRVFGCHKDETGFHLHVWLWRREQEDFQTCQDLKFNIKRWQWDFTPRWLNSSVQMKLQQLYVTAERCQHQQEPHQRGGVDYLLIIKTINLWGEGPKNHSPERDWKLQWRQSGGTRRDWWETSTLRTCGTWSGPSQATKAGGGVHHVCGRWRYEMSCRWDRFYARFDLKESAAKFTLHAEDRPLSVSTVDVRRIWLKPRMKIWV